MYEYIKWKPKRKIRPSIHHLKATASIRDGHTHPCIFSSLYLFSFIRWCVCVFFLAAFSHDIISTQSIIYHTHINTTITLIGTSLYTLSKTKIKLEPTDSIKIINLNEAKKRNEKNCANVLIYHYF